MAKAKKDMTPKERRDQLIKDRADRLARDAKKQGMTPAELMKKKQDTYVNVVGGAALGALPVGAVLRGAGALFKGLTGGGKAAKTATKATKAAPKAKPAAKKPAAKKQTAAKKPAAKPTSKAAQKTAAAKSKITKAEAAGRAVAAGAAKTKGAATSAASKARASANRLKSRATAAAKKPGVGQRARNAILGGAATSAALNVIDKAKKSGTAKASTSKATVTGPKSRPKRGTGMSAGNTVAGSSGRDPRTRNAPNVGLGKMPKKAAPKKVPSTKSRDKDGQGTGKINLPAGAKRKFSGGYNSKTEKLRNIGGKTYVFNK